MPHLYLQIMGNKLVTYTAYFNHQHLFLLSMATKTVTPSSAEGALIWTSKFSDFLIIINPNSKNSFCVHERSCSHNIRVNQILWRIHFQRSVSLDSRSCRAGMQKILPLNTVWSDSKLIFKNDFNIHVMEKASYWLQHEREWFVLKN